MNKIKITLLFLGATAILFAYASEEKSTNEEEVWKNFTRKFGKKFRSNRVANLKHDHFVENYRKIQKHNEKFNSGNATYRRGFYKYHDSSKDEFIRTHCGTMYDPLMDNDTSIRVFEPQTRASPPPTWDIRIQGPGLLPPIEEQGDCSGCWAFAAAAALSNGYSIKTGKLLELSVQQQLDCNKDCFGCRGGYIQRVFRYTKNGLTLEQSYPFIGWDSSCKSDYSPEVSNVDFVQLPNDNDAIKNYIASNGACTVCVDGTNWWDYYGGIFNGVKGTPKCNHAVLLVGYGPNYWLIQNSWGDWWGENGFIRVEDSSAGGMFKNMIYCPTF